MNEKARDLVGRAYKLRDDLNDSGMHLTENFASNTNMLSKEEADSMAKAYWDAAEKIGDMLEEFLEDYDEVFK